MSTAIGYLRVSTDEQHLGPEAQRASIEAWAVREGVTVVAWFSEAVSGAAPLEDRRALMDAVDAIREQGASMLVVAKRDRLARDVVLTAMIERMVARHQARVVSADGVGAEDSPEGALMRRIVDAFAEYERAVIRARTKAALRAKAARGERVSRRAPFGYRIDGDCIVPDDRAQRAIKRIHELHSSGVKQRGIVAALVLEGLPAPSQSVVSKLLSGNRAA